MAHESASEVLVSPHWRSNMTDYYYYYYYYDSVKLADNFNASVLSLS